MQLNDCAIGRGLGFYPRPRPSAMFGISESCELSYRSFERIVKFGFSVLVPTLLLTFNG